jgi:hypothetical protein
MFMSRLYCGRRGDIRKYILQGRARALENQDFLAACNIMLLFDIVMFKSTTISKQHLRLPILSSDNLLHLVQQPTDVVSYHIQCHTWYDMYKALDFTPIHIPCQKCKGLLSSNLYDRPAFRLWDLDDFR